MGWLADLITPEQRRRYIATFYTSRFWAQPGAFMGDASMVFGPYGGTPEVDFHAEPFADAASSGLLRWLRERVRPQPAASAGPPGRATGGCGALLLFGTADHVIYPAFDEMAAVVFPDHDGPHRLDGCGHFVPWEAPDVLVGSTSGGLRPPAGVDPTQTLNEGGHAKRGGVQGPDCSRGSRPSGRSCRRGSPLP